MTTAEREVVVVAGEHDTVPLVVHWAGQDDAVVAGVVLHHHTTPLLTHAHAEHVDAGQDQVTGVEHADVGLGPGHADVSMRRGHC